MKIISPSTEIMDHISMSPLKHIEKIGRICYKSEDKITVESAPKFVLNLYNHKHFAMLEHYRFVLMVSDRVYESLQKLNPRFLVMTNDGNHNIISGSARTFIDLRKRINLDDDTAYYLDHIIYKIVLYYNCGELFGNSFNIVDPKYMNNDLMIISSISIKESLTDEQYNAHGWQSVRFVVDRGVSHELIRHRDASFAQESTRYCNYKGDMQFIYPSFFILGTDNETSWVNAMEHIEMAYNVLIDYGATPQEARTVLPNSLKTEIVVTATINEWIHIFELRALDKTGKAHPQMKEIMLPLYKEFINKRYLRYEI